MHQKESYRVALRYLGLILISAVFPLSIGYYLGDRGFRWLPNTVGIMIICLFIGVSCLLASSIVGSIVDQPGKKVIFKKRIIVLCILLVTIIAVYLPTHQLSNATPLTRMASDQFQAMVSNHVELLDTYNSEMDGLLEQMYSRQDLFADSDNHLTNSDEQYLRQCWLALYNYAFGIDQIRKTYHDWFRFDISRSQRAGHVQSFLLLYDADLIGFEKALRIISLIDQNPNIAAFLNAPHPNSTIPNESYSQLKQQLFGSDNQTRILSGELYLKWLDQGLNAKNTTYAGSCRKLWDDIENRLAQLEQMDILDRGKKIIDADMEFFRQGFSHIWFPAQKGVAEWMGDTRLRRVGYYLISPELQTQLDEMLEPGDIMLSRKNWYMSNVGLPGFWPHAILYTGSPEKLTAYFNDPAINEYLKKLTGQNLSFDAYMARQYPQKWLKYTAGTGQSDYHVIEAIKYGVVLNPLSKACGDYMAAIRPKLDKVAKAQTIIEAFRHLDKPYDFDFDFATDHALVCTELVWRSYRPDTQKQGLNLELLEIAGRKTLPANEIAKCYVQEKQTDHQQFDFVCFIDAVEKDEEAHFSDESAFLESVNRSKWSFMQE